MARDDEFAFLFNSVVTALFCIAFVEVVERVESTVGIVGLFDKSLYDPLKFDVPAPILALALLCCVELSSWSASVETARKLPTFPSPTSLFV